MRSLVGYVGVPDRDRDDVVQDAMVRLWEKREQARSARNPTAFRDSVVLNTARDHRRAARRREEALTGLDEAALCDARQSPEEEAIARQEAALVRQLVDRIGARCRGVFIACELEERPIADVAREQGIPLETARSRLRRAWEEFEEAAARWEARQRGRGARRLRAVLFPPWLSARRSSRPGGSARRSSRPGGSARWMARGFAAAFAAALGALVTGPVQPVEPLRASMATLVSTTTARAARDPDEGARVVHALQEAVRGSPALQEAVRGSPALQEAVRGSPALQEAVRGSPALQEVAGSPALAEVAGSPALQEAVTTSAAPTTRTGTPAAQLPGIGSRERALIARARTAVEAGDVVSLVEARRLLEEHGRRFPRGRLAGEREALLDELR